jgi:hypothetical protein
MSALYYASMATLLLLLLYAPVWSPVYILARLISEGY